MFVIFVFVIFVIVIVIVIVVVSMPEDEVTVDRVALVIDHLDVVQQPVHRLRLSDLRHQFGYGVVALVHLADFLRLLAVLHGHSGVLHLDLVVVDLDRLGDGDGPQGEIGFDRQLRLWSRRLDELFGGLAGGRHPRLEVDALHLELARHVLGLGLHLRPDHRLGSVDLDEAGERLGQLAHHRRANPGELALGQAVADRRRPFLDRLEFACVVGDPFVGELRKFERLDRLDRDREVGGLLGARGGGREVQHVARLGAGQLLVEVFGDPTLSQLVGPILGVEARDLLAVTAGGDVEREEVAGRGGPIDVDQSSARTKLGSLCLVQLLVGRERRVEFDPQAGVARHGDLRANLALGLELDQPFLLAAGDLDVGCRHQIDIVFANGLAEVLRDRIAQRLLPGRADADPGLQNAARCLAVAEARELHFAGDHTEGLFDILVELGLIDLDVQLDFVPLEGFDRRFHRASTLPAGER